MPRFNVTIVWDFDGVPGVSHYPASPHYIKDGETGEQALRRELLEALATMPYSIGDAWKSITIEPQDKVMSIN